MAAPLTKSAFFADLVAHIQAHSTQTQTDFVPLSLTQLQWSPAPKEWSILQCFDHLNQTHDYYMAKIQTALASQPPRAQTGQDIYRPSFWARIYMFFALNPRFTFPAPAATVPQAQPDARVLDIYLGKQQQLLSLLEEVEEIDLTRTILPIEKNVRFNLGDCLKILVYHDALHLRQAENIIRMKVEGGTPS